MIQPVLIRIERSYMDGTGMKRIMVVDDDPDQTHTIKQLLEEGNKDYQVVCASSGSRCLNYLVKNQNPDLILLDIMMPKMNGWETFKKLKANESWRDIPVIFITARTDDFAERAGSFLGTEYIRKPFDSEELKNKIKEILTS